MAELPAAIDPRRPRLIELDDGSGMVKAVAVGNLAGVPVEVVATVPVEVAERLTIEAFGGGQFWHLRLTDGVTIWASTVVRNGPVT